MDFYSKEIIKKMGAPFGPIARWGRIKIDERDLDYVVNVIKKDKCFPPVSSSVADIKPGLEYAYAVINNIVFYEKFYNDADCPPGVKLILFALLGFYRDYIETTYPDLLTERYHYVERWLENVGEV